MFLLLQQHNKNIQKRQKLIQYNNTTKTYRNAKTQYNTTRQQKHTETSKANTIQQLVVLSWVLTFLYVFVVLLYCIGSWRFCMFLLCYCIVLGFGVSVWFCCVVAETSRPNTIQQDNKNIQKRQDPIQYNSTTKTYRNVKTQYNTTAQQKHTETSKPNFCLVLLCCCIVLGLDVSV
jgi:Flp pilus assembly protein TadB